MPFCPLILMPEEESFLLLQGMDGTLPFVLWMGFAFHMLVFRLSVVSKPFCSPRNDNKFMVFSVVYGDAVISFVDTLKQEKVTLNLMYSPPSAENWIACFVIGYRPFISQTIKGEPLMSACVPI